MQDSSHDTTTTTDAPTTSASPDESSHVHSATTAMTQRTIGVEMRSSGGSHMQWLTPPWLRWDPVADHTLDWSRIILFALTAACSVANIYYSHPILNVLANEFGISDERASLVPTIMQAGYACGLLFVIPLGDLLPRRLFVLGLMLVTVLFWLGCILTNSFNTFLGLSFIVGITTVTPQLMFPLTTQYAPARHKAMMISIVMSGVVFGIVVARILSGVVAQFTHWRVVYWISLGWQLIIIILLSVTMPDYPILHKEGLSYPGILLKIVKLPFQYPVLTQQSIIAFMVMGVYTNFWTTLTFQLTHVFQLDTLSVGLFALIGLAPVLANPFISRFLTARVHPTGTLLVALTTGLTGALVGTFTGTSTLAGPIVWAFLGDLAMNTSVVASRMAFSHVEPRAQNAVNAVYMVFTFCGQLTGTAAGNALYAKGGWRSSGGLAVGMLGVALGACVVRGPRMGEKGWVGWKGGWDLRGSSRVDRDGKEKGEDGSGSGSGSGSAGGRDVGDVGVGAGAGVDVEKGVVLGNGGDESEERTVVAKDMAFGDDKEEGGQRPGKESEV